MLLTRPGGQDEADDRRPGYRAGCVRSVAHDADGNYYTAGSADDAGAAAGRGSSGAASVANPCANTCAHACTATGPRTDAASQDDPPRHGGVIALVSRRGFHLA